MYCKNCFKLHNQRTPNKNSANYFFLVSPDIIDGNKINFKVCLGVRTHTAQRIQEVRSLSRNSSSVRRGLSFELKKNQKKFCVQCHLKY